MLFICTFDDINYYHYVRKYIHFDLILTFSDMTSAVPGGLRHETSIGMLDLLLQFVTQNQDYLIHR